jgi:hypothetical protein
VGDARVSLTRRHAGDSVAVVVGNGARLS